MKSLSWSLFCSCLLALCLISLTACEEEVKESKYEFVETCKECTLTDCCSCECKIGAEEIAEYYLCAGIVQCKEACIDLCGDEAEAKAEAAE